MNYPLYGYIGQFMVCATPPCSGWSFAEQARAAALGSYLADKIVGGRADLDGLFAVERKFPVGPAVQSVIRAPAAFALSHGILKFL